MLEDLKQEALEANLLLIRHGLVPLTWGNASAVDRARGILAIKPSGVPYDALGVQDMVLVDLEGAPVEDGLRPSSDTPTHVCLYRTFPQLGGVVHTHSPMATAFAQAGRPIPCYGTTHADYFHGEVPLTRALAPPEVRHRYEWNTGQVIAERFRDLDVMACPAVLVRHHGPFAWGASAQEAARTAVVLETLADMAFHSLLLNPSLDPMPEYLLERHYRRKHGRHAYYGQKSGPSVKRP